MKKILYTFIVSNFIINALAAQSLKDILNQAVKKDSNINSVVEKAKQILPSTGNGSTNLSNNDIISGLKEALRVGTDSSTKKLSAVNGFLGDAVVKIVMPEEAKKVENTLRTIGMGNLVDKAVLSMNRAAEDAAKGVGTIFWNSITNMSIVDGVKILRGGDFAATQYLKLTTTLVLTQKFKPIIQASLVKFDATKYWKDVFTAYNRVSVKKVNTDLVAYVTDKALSGLFYNIGLQEQKIRKDPAAQVTGILKQVFGNQ